jgi:hypothetical protein
MLRLAICCGLLAVAWGTSAFAQPCEKPPEMRAAIQNLNFSEGPRDSAPPGWFLNGSKPPRTPYYEATTVSGASCSDGRQCGQLRSILQAVREDLSTRLGFLYQIIDATPYRGKTLRYQAKVRTDVTAGSVARLLVRIHRTDCSTSFRDDMGNRPITAAGWSTYEIQAPIALDARDIEFGMQLVGHGAAWIDGISLTFSGAKQ